jgi:hypothetical protein
MGRQESFSLPQKTKNQSTKNNQTKKRSKKQKKKITSQSVGGLQTKIISTRRTNTDRDVFATTITLNKIPT